MANPCPLEFFETLYPKRLTRGKLALYTTTLSRGNHHSDWCLNLPQADRLCTSYRKTRRVRFGVALQSSERALAIAKRRRSRSVVGKIHGCEASVTALPALWVEIPYRPDASRVPAHRHDAPSQLPDRRQAFDLLAAVRQRPSIVVSTGDALCAYWLFEKLWVFDLEDGNATDKTEAKALLRRLQWAIASLAAERGWPLTATGDLAASFPVPGSPTGASAGGPRAALLAFPLVSGDSRYRPSDFESLPEPPADDPQPWRQLLDRPPSHSGLERQTHDFRPIADGCSWIRHCLAQRETLTKEELELAMELLSWCSAPGADSRQLIHELHGGHPGYESFDVDQQLAALLRASGGPITCPRIGKSPGVAERHCSSCPHYGLIDSPVELAAENLVADAHGLPSGQTAEAGTGPVAGTDDRSQAARPRIVITCRQHEVNDQALAALSQGADLFERAGALVELRRNPAAAPTILRVKEPRLQELLSRHCNFVETGKLAGGKLAGGKLADGEPREAAPPRWTTRALLARGRWPELPQLANDTGAPVPSVDASGDPPTDVEANQRGGPPVPRVGRASAATELLAGVAQVLGALGGEATCRGILLALASDPERFAVLRAAWPELDPADPTATTALGYRLRALKHRVLGGRCLVEARRTRDGIAWAVEKCTAAPPPTNDLKEAA